MIYFNKDVILYYIRDVLTYFTHGISKGKYGNTGIDKDDISFLASVDDLKGMRYLTNNFTNLSSENKRTLLKFTSTRGKLNILKELCYYNMLTDDDIVYAILHMINLNNIKRKHEKLLNFLILSCNDFYYIYNDLMRRTESGKLYLDSFKREIDPDCRVLSIIENEYNSYQKLHKSMKNLMVI